MALKNGATFLQPGTGGVSDPAKCHLMVCLQIDGDDVFVVPIVSKHPYSDGTCVLQVGEHEFIARVSCADYGLIKKCSKAALEKEIEAGTYKCFEFVTLEIFIRLLEGVLASEEVEPWAIAGMTEAKLTGRIAAYKKMLAES